MKRSTAQRGYVVIILAILFAALGLIMVLGGSSPVLSHFSSMQGFAYSQQALMASNSGISEALYRLKTGKQLPSSVTLSLNTGSSTITSVATASGKKVTVSGIQKSYERDFQMDLAYGEGISFHYGIQSGQGGFVLQNSSSVTGNVYSNGTVVGSGGNYIYGDVISAGASGLISGIHATGTAYAHTINSATIDKDAYYQSSSGATVSGTRYPGSTDQDAADMPISDSEISDWETWAATDVATCTAGTYTITTSTSIGPKKIPCDLLIKGNGIVVTITGPVWVVGNFTTQNGPTIQIGSGLGSENVAIIADNPSARTSQGIVTIGQNTQFQGSGSTGSYVFTVSGNTAAENGINTNAIDMGQSAGALVTYSNHGQVTLGQSVGIKSVTAYKIVLTNTANVTYDSGLASTLFKAGPGGGYDLLDWFEY